MGKRVLIAEDDREIVKVVRAYLERAGFNVLTSYDGKEALFMAQQERPDLVILDLMLPEMDGLDVCRLLRRESDIPIIMLTARVEEVDKLVGLELGADDYITKPFSPRELVARVRATLRRAERASEPEIISVGEVTIDQGRHMVKVGSREVELTPTEFDLLTVLMRHPGQVFTRLQLLDRVQGYAYAGYERTIDVHIKNLRRKIEPQPHKPRYILTVHGVGYKFVEEKDAR
jgi:DNA-binding response OmpR family regulator